LAKEWCKIKDGHRKNYVQGFKIVLLKARDCLWLMLLVSITLPWQQIDKPRNTDANTLVENMVVLLRSSFLEFQAGEKMRENKMMRDEQSSLVVHICARGARMEIGIQ
jgi:hypothetical protein